MLAAIEAADQAHAARTSEVEAHERKRSADSGRKAIPDHFPRIVIEHDLPADAKLCTQCAVPHALTCIGQETRECYLHYLFEYLPAASTVEQIEALLPWNVTLAQLAEHQKKQDQLLHAT